MIRLKLLPEDLRILFLSNDYEYRIYYDIIFIIIYVYPALLKIKTFFFNYNLNN